MIMPRMIVNSDDSASTNKGITMTGQPEKLDLTSHDIAEDKRQELLRRDPDVISVEPNYVVQALPEFPQLITAASRPAISPTTGDDPLRASQWALTKISAPAAWQVTTGSADVVVAVEIDPRAVGREPRIQW